MSAKSPVTHSAFDNWVSESKGAEPHARTLFGYMYERNVVRYAMFAEAIFLLPVAIGHIATPTLSLSPMLRSGYKVNDVGSIITQWYGVNCLAIALFGILCSSAGQNKVGYILRKFFYAFQLTGEGCVIPLFFMLIHKYGEWNFSSVNYVFGTILFSTLRVICLTIKPQWFGINKNEK